MAPVSSSARHACRQAAKSWQKVPLARSGALGWIAVTRIEVRDLGEPEAVVSYPLGATHQVRLAGTVVSHHVLQPGWRWETHAQSESVFDLKAP